LWQRQDFKERPPSPQIRLFFARPAAAREHKETTDGTDELDESKQKTHDWG